MTTIATWNLHHMGRSIQIPDGVVQVIKQVRPDVLVLTEYVDRGAFKADLQEKCGYAFSMVSLAGNEPRQNQVLMASRVEQEVGGLSAPEVDEAATTNFLHRRFKEFDLEVVGFRAPHYQSEKPMKPENLLKYWRQFKKMALEKARQKVVFIGDFNIGVKNVDEPGRSAIASLVRKGFRLVDDQGGLDRALLSPGLRLKSFSVIEAVGSHRLTGRRGETALSDHPMLLVEVE